QAPSPEIWSETISGGEEVLAGNGVACFWATSLEKNYRRRDRDRLVPPRRGDAAVWRAEVCYPFGPQHGKASGSETARVHVACRRRSGDVAAPGEGAATGDAGDRLFQRPGARCRGAAAHPLPEGIGGIGLHGRAQRCDRIPFR